MDFSFIQCELSREVCQTAADAISQLELWDFVKKDPGEGGFMLSNAPEIEKISKRIDELGFKDHSGASFGITMRGMQKIALHGFDKYKQDYLDKHSKKN